MLVSLCYISSFGDRSEWRIYNHRANPDFSPKSLKKVFAILTSEQGTVPEDRDWWLMKGVD